MHSRAITRKSASNLALAFVLLPRAKRDAMSALYAFCREVDDVADNESVPAGKTPRTARRLARRREPRLRKSNPAICRQPRIPARHPTIQPAASRCSTNLIKGCEMDLDIKRYENFEAAGKVLLPRRVRRRPLEHRDFRLQKSGVPRLCRLSRQGAAIHQHPARRENRRRARDGFICRRSN